MKHYLISLALIAFVGSLSACVKISDKDKDDVASAADYYVEATETPNQFLVHLPPLGNASEIRRQSESHPETAAIAISDLRANGNGLVDRHPNAGEKYKYLYVDDNGKVVRLVEVDVPQDLVIDRAVALTKSPDWHNVYRVLFTKSGVLTTNGFNIVLHAQRIEADQGVIRTFAPGQIADTGKNGRSGGEIRIFASEAHGSLTLEMRGENGGLGSVPNAKVRNGGNGGVGGNAGNIFLDIAGVDDLKTIFVNQAGAKGIGVKGAAAGYIGGMCLYGQCSPSVHVGPGQNGVDGSDGQLGQFCTYQAGRLIDCRQQ